MTDDSAETKESQQSTDENSNSFKKPPDSHKVGKYTPLHWAAYKGHLVVVQILMNEKLDPTEIDVHGNNAVHQAAAASRLEVMKLFMSAGVDLDVANDRGHSPFDLATDPEIKALINKLRKTQNCCGSKCGKAKFSF